MLTALYVHLNTRIFLTRDAHARLDRANAYKEEGNYLFKQKKYKEAKTAYSEAIKQKCEDPATNAILYCNRATMEYHVGELSVGVACTRRSFASVLSVLCAIVLC